MAKKIVFLIAALCLPVFMLEAQVDSVKCSSDQVSTEQILISLQKQLAEMQLKLDRIDKAVVDTVPKGYKEVIPAKAKSTSKFYWSLQFGCFFSSNQYLMEEGSKKQLGTHFSFAVKPAFGYVFTDRWTAGATIVFADCQFSGLNPSSFQYMLANALLGGGFAASDYITWNIQPYVRYRITHVFWPRLNLWAEFSGYAGQNIPKVTGTHKLDYANRSAIYGLKLQPMLTCDLNRNLMVFTKFEFMSYNGSLKMDGKEGKINNSFSFEFIPIYSILSGLFQIGIIKKF